MVKPSFVRRMSHPIIPSSSKRCFSSEPQSFLGNTKPLIILLGWLGSTPRTLNRYAQLYDRLGCQVIIRILPPVMVINASTTPLSPLPRDINRLLSHSMTSTSRPSRDASYKPYNTTDAAVDILQEITDRGHPHFIIHNFSNGGCFLYEKICQILAYKLPVVEEKDNRSHDININPLKEKLIGVVFDSSPAAYHTRLDILDSAIMHVPIVERLQLKLQMLSQQWIRGKEMTFETIKRRSNDYWNTLMCDTWDIPQLYIYSKVDNLTDWEELEKLIIHRRGHFGEHMIHSLRFEDSLHCCHLLRYPTEYKGATESFLELCINRLLEKEKCRPLLSKL